MVKRILFLVLLFTFLCSSADAQTQHSSSNDVKIALENYFHNYNYQQEGLPQPPTLKNFSIDLSHKTISVIADEYFSQQFFTKKKLQEIIKDIQKCLPSVYEKFSIDLRTDGRKVSDIVSEVVTRPSTHLSQWGAINYNGRPWVQPVFQEGLFSKGLQDRHIAVWASHGCYYDQKEQRWRWQRPNFFCTTEDLFTQTIMLPYLIPMLQKAGAVVWTPRERDWQTNEVIVDNDKPSAGYFESKGWKPTKRAGFSTHNGVYHDGENPFVAGTARKTKSTSNPNRTSYIIYTPTFPEEGDYAVYVSYQTERKSCDRVRYVVSHQGIETGFDVNQQMGGGTWVYIGTFHFDKGSSSRNCVKVLSYSTSKGVITSDAIRFGGGMGNIERGGKISGLPRFAEAARYSAQWYGAPKELVSINEGTHDYNDDINVRSLMENWLAGGSIYVPNRKGLCVPFELSLAMHSDAGYKKDGSNYGTLGICTTDYKGNLWLNSGLSRSVSKDFATQMLDQVCNDLSSTYPIAWPNRTVWDKNYNECRRPEVPSAIIETLSHQNFSDMCLGLDPNFRFTLSRAIYKAIARFIGEQHNSLITISPLSPKNFRIGLMNNQARLMWDNTEDSLETTAVPTRYRVCSRIGGNGMDDNGVIVSQPNALATLLPDSLYSFRVSALNDGGESFPSEELSVLYHPKATKTILVVNGFTRLSSPEVVNTPTRKGFELDIDPGVTYGPTAGWAGRQTIFDASKVGGEGPGSLGYGGNELAGKIIAGNSFNYVRDHAEAISSAKTYNIVSCSESAIENGLVNMNDYDGVDLILGMQKDDGHSLIFYKSFTPRLQKAISDYTANGGRILVSGSYVGSDMQKPTERAFLSNIFKSGWTESEQQHNKLFITGLGLDFSIYQSLNEQHYAAISSDVVSATLPQAFTAMTYSDGKSAAIAYDGADYKSFIMGFPFECIKEKVIKSKLMKGIFAFLLK